MKAHAVFFDAVGTLLHVEPSVSEAYAAAGRRHGSRLHLEEIHRRFRQAFQEQEALDRVLGYRTSEAREVERWRSIVARVLDDVASPEKCFRELWEHFASPQAWRVDPAAARLLAQAQRRGAPIGLASNFDQRLRVIAAALLPNIKPESIVISSEVGWKKPAGQFFDAVCAAVGLPADAITFVGDDPVNDYAGAQAAGMKAVLFDASTAGQIEVL